MKQFLILCCFLTLIQHTWAQITKHNWLVGGSARIAKEQEKLIGSDVNSLDVQLSPNIGYFPLDKFAAGLKPYFGFAKLKTPTFTDKTSTLGIGPFIRYYFLPVDKRVNIFAESDYQYLTDFKGYSQNRFIFSAGPVIFFNSSVGIESTLNYQIIRTNGSGTDVKTFFIGIGFQIHLQKEEAY
jgi:hypothetical protein